MDINEIKVAGYQPQSFLDYPEKVSCVIFLGGCNFRCHYCHNSQIFSPKSNSMSFVEVFADIESKKKFLDGVVISGGEPTLFPRLREIINAIRGLGLLVKLDTNGTNFEILKKLVNEKLVDFVAMDIKAPLSRYADITGVPLNDDVAKSIEFLKTLEKDKYMFRTTLSPYLNGSDFTQIAEEIAGAGVYQIQQFIPNEFSKSNFVALVPYSKDEAQTFADIVSKTVAEVRLRGF
ncbi:MAG: anaerobic ribonucleoside-triphosphate reductase activating protein [Christensenellaceae bacterium]|jgi:pyruvate formate lyase activating enzyme|nr:anaerobic ribonucleoside-triphosphate reductase activating protein [Christensenellaceae bacterium]